MVFYEMWCVVNFCIKLVEIQGDSVVVCFYYFESCIQFEYLWLCFMVIKDGYNLVFYLINVMELLDEFGEWYYDIESCKIYYYFWKGEKISKVVVFGIEMLVWVEGMIDCLVKYICFDNIVF